MRTIILSFIFVSLCTLKAYAHSPYFTQIEKQSSLKFGEIEYAILNGDGIIFSDPQRVVVIDSDGFLLAATSQAYTLSINCNVSEVQGSCLIYDELESVIFEPNYSAWQHGRRIKESDGRPPRDAYPEYMDIEYGFSVRPATFGEVLYFEAATIFRSPFLTIFAVIWWSVAWAFLTKIGWRWKHNGWQLQPIKTRPLALSILSIFAFVVMALLAAFGRWLEPYSIYYFLFVFMSGAVVAIVATRPMKSSSH